MARSSNLPSSRSLLQNGEVEYFNTSFKNYDDAVKIKSSLKGKKNDLVELDKWYQHDLPAAIKGRGSNAHLTQEELIKLMNWKLTRGKFRPRLVQFAASNSDEFVQKCTSDGLALVSKDMEKSMKTICALKGVGPATASAILAAAAPHKCAFFADEVAYAVFDVSGGLKYSDAEYIELNSVLKSCATRLNATSRDTSAPWTPHKVELALWSYDILSRDRPTLFHDTEKKLSGKRKHSSDGDEPNKKK